MSASTEPTTPKSETTPESKATTSGAPERPAVVFTDEDKIRIQYDAIHGRSRRGVRF